ncbi:hypothetical protein L0128_16880 [candidate division KSB1 bacterium]|nr:hypothetical protein [candidate division KSB1 bacterium]
MEIYTKIKTIMESVYLLLCEHPVSIETEVSPAADYCHYRVKCNFRDKDRLYRASTRARAALATIANEIAAMNGGAVRITYISSL